MDDIELDDDSEDFCDEKEQLPPVNNKDLLYLQKSLNKVKESYKRFASGEGIFRRLR